jgi:hypothetical protein
MDSKRRQTEDEVKVRELQARLKSAGEAQARLQSAKEQSGDLNDSNQQSSEVVLDGDDDVKVDTTDVPSSSVPKISDKEARLIGMFSDGKN